MALELCNIYSIKCSQRHNLPNLNLPNFFKLCSPFLDLEIIYLCLRTLEVKSTNLTRGDVTLLYFSPFFMAVVIS